MKTAKVYRALIHVRQVMKTLIMVTRLFAERNLKISWLNLCTVTRVHVAYNTFFEVLRICIVLIWYDSCFVPYFPHFWPSSLFYSYLGRCIFGVKNENRCHHLARGQINIRCKQLIKSCRFCSSSLEYHEETFERFWPNIIGAVTTFLRAYSK